MSEVLVVPNMHKKSFLDFFPVPKFLVLSTVGLSISDRTIRFVEFKNKAGSDDLELEHSIEYPLPAGAVVDGYIHDKAAVSKVLKEIKSKYSLDYVKATLPEEKAYLFIVEVDAEPFNSVRDRVAFTVEENVPVALANSIFDFEIIGDVKGKSQIKVAVSVLPKKVIEAYLEVLETSGITAVSLEVESQAIARSIIPIGDERPHLIINLGEEKTGLYIVEDEVVQFSSTTAYGTRRIDSVYPDLLNLKTEARRLFAFWNTRLDKEGVPEKRIEKIMLTGVGAVEEDFVLQFMMGIDIEYSIANVWVNSFSLKNYLPEISFQDSLTFAAAIGVALPDKEPKYV